MDQCLLLLSIYSFDDKRLNHFGIEINEEGSPLKQPNKIEMLFSLFKEQYQVVTIKVQNIRDFLSGMYASSGAYQLSH